MPAIELAEVPQGELLTMCSEAGLSKEQIDAVIFNRNHYLPVTREAGETIERIEMTLADPAVAEANRVLKVDAEKRRRTTRGLWVYGIGGLGFWLMVFFGAKHLGAWMFAAVVAWMFAVVRIEDWVNRSGKGQENP